MKWADTTMPGALEVLESVSAQPGITDLDPAECTGVLSGLASVQAQGHLHLFRPDGSLVCSLQAPELQVKDIPKGEWFQRVIDTHARSTGGQRSTRCPATRP